MPEAGDQSHIGVELQPDATDDPVQAFLAALPDEAVDQTVATEALAAEEHARQVGVNKTLTEWVNEPRLLGFLKTQERDAIFAWDDFTALPPGTVPEGAAGRYPVGMLTGDGTLKVRAGNTKEANYESEYALVRPEPDGSYEFRGQRRYVNPGGFDRQDTTTYADWAKENVDFTAGGVFIQVKGNNVGTPLAKTGFFPKTGLGLPALTGKGMKENLASDLKQAAPIPPLAIP